MTPYQEPGTPSQRGFNRALRTTRSIIERSFGILKRRFHILHGEVRMAPERVCTITVACCILHNIAIENNEPLPDDIEEHPNVDIPFAGVETGQGVRNYIANTYFQIRTAIITLYFSSLNTNIYTDCTIIFVNKLMICKNVQ